MKNLTTFLSFVFLITINAQTVYDVTPGTKSNQIILSLSNISEITNAENVTVKLLKSSSNLLFKHDEQVIKRIDAKGESEAAFSFDIKREAPVNTKDSVEFLITDNKTVFQKKLFVLNYTPPTGYRLEQNFPNPFNPVTTIQYQLPVNAKVTLKVYDILGAEVATLVNEVQEAGYRQVRFDALALSSGVYIYRLAAGNYISIKKMMVIK
jgi:hypothetical protein